MHAYIKSSMHAHSSFLSLPCSLDSDQKDQLIEVIEKLLADKTTVSVFFGVGGGMGEPVFKVGYLAQREPILRLLSL